jgi:WD40 repeat protein
MGVSEQSTHWEYVHVFVCSTFDDMHAERDYLVKQVFPRLHEWCERRRLRLIDVDLRWGLSATDATHHKNVVPACLGRIDRCWPFFVCFLGHRYGWIPGPEDFDTPTLEQFPGLVDALANRYSITELETRHATVRSFRSGEAIATRPDASAGGASFYLRSDSFLDDLPEEPQLLRRTYADGVVGTGAQSGLPDGDDSTLDDESRVKQQVLRELTVTSTHRPVRHYSAKWLQDLRTPEIMMPLECPAAQEQGQRRWRDDWLRADVRLEEHETSVPASQRPKAESFNRALTRGRLGAFRCESEALGDVLFKDLTEAIAARFPQHLEVEFDNDLQRELDQHEQFLFANSESFLRREGDYDELNAYVNGSSNQLFVLADGSGMGKSMLLANWIAGWRTEMGDDVHASIHARFLGASDGSTRIYNTQRYLLRELAEVVGKIDDEIPTDKEELRQAWTGMLETAGALGKTIIVIDAVDQLESGLSDVSWIPRRLPPGVKFIISFKSDDEPGRRLLRSYETDDVVLSSIIPFDGHDERRSLVRVHLSQYLKELDDHHVERLIRSPGAGNPLFLKVVLSELRVFGAATNLADKIARDFGETPTSAFNGMLERLESDPACTEVVPSVAVPLLFSLLAHARHGLSVDELTELFRMDLARGAPSGSAIRDTIHLLIRQVRPYLARRDGRYGLFYGSFADAVRERYSTTASGARPRRRTEDLHRLLADFFETQDWWSELQEEQRARCRRLPPTARPVNVRKVVELPFHVIRAAREAEAGHEPKTLAQHYGRVEDLFSDLRFLEAKTEGGFVLDLVGDFRQAVTALPRIRPRRPILRLLGDAIHRDAQFIADHPTSLFQCLWNSCWWHDSPQAPRFYRVPEGASGHTPPWLRSGPKLHELVERWREEKSAEGTDRPFVRSRRPPQTPLTSTVRRVFRADESPVSALAVSADDQLTVIGTDDGSVFILTEGFQLALTERHAHAGRVNAIAMSPDGALTVSGGGDGRVRTWSLRESRALEDFVPPGEAGRGIHDLAFSPRGELAVADYLGHIRLWKGGECRPFLSIQTEALDNHHLSFSPDGRHITSWMDTNTQLLNPMRFVDKWFADSLERESDRWVPSFRVWDKATGEMTKLLTWPEDHFQRAALSPRALFLLGLESSGTFRYLDLEDGTEIRSGSFTDHVERLQFSSDGASLALGLRDGTVRVADVDTHEVRFSFRHAHVSVTTLQFCQDGEALVAGFGNGDVLKFDLSGQGHSQDLVCHEDEITSMAVCRDESRLVTASDDKTVRLWDVGTGEQTSLIQCDATIPCFAVSKDNRFLALGGVGESLESRRNGAELAFSRRVEKVKCRILDLETGREVRAFSGFAGAVLAVAFSPTDDIVAGAGGTNAVLTDAAPDFSVRLWNVRTGALVHRLQGHESMVYYLDFSPDGRLVASGANSIRVWDVDDAEEVLVFDGVQSLVDMAFATSELLVARSAAEEIFVLNSVTGRLIKKLPGDRHRFWAVTDTLRVNEVEGALRPRYLASMSRRRTRFYDLSSGKLVALYPEEFEALRSVGDGSTWVGFVNNLPVVLAIEN